MELDDTPPDKRKSLLKGQRTKHTTFLEIWIEMLGVRLTVGKLKHVYVVVVVVLLCSPFIDRPTAQGRKKKKKKKISGEKCVWLFSLLLFDWAWNSCRRGVISRERRHHPRSFMLWVLFFSFTSFRNFFFYYAFLYVYFSLMTGLRTVTLSLADSCTT